MHLDSSITTRATELQIGSVSKPFCHFSQYWPIEFYINRPIGHYFLIKDCRNDIIDP